MATQKPIRDSNAKRVHKVRINRPKNRPYQLRYTDPETGQDVRISTHGRDEKESQRLKQELEAKLLLGIETKPSKTIRGPKTLWDDFRLEYSTLHLSTLRDKSAVDSESRLDIAEKIIGPKTLGDMAEPDTLKRLQSSLRAGAQSKKNRPRSPHTVNGYMAVVVATLNWAAEMEWLPGVPKIRKLKTSKLKHMKGRPISLEEFERMLAMVKKVVCKHAKKWSEADRQTLVDSWVHTLWGLWDSGLRIAELMHVSWNDANEIRPVWRRGADPVLAIPHHRQKNATEEAIPITPAFESLLLETPERDRVGWIFNPQSVSRPGQTEPRDNRGNPEWISRIISRIGKAAGAIVEPAKDGGEPKYASAHDLRRSFAERLIDAGVPEREVARVMRHASPQTTRRYYAGGNVQKSSSVIRACLGASTKTGTHREPVPVFS